MTQLAGKTVLVVEDEQALAGFIQESLHEIDLETYHAGDAEHAIEYLEQNTPDLIMLDIGLPGQSGWQLLELLEKRRQEDDIYIIVSTAFQDPANRLVGKLQKVDFYLAKPFTFKQLTSVVTELLTTGSIASESDSDSTTENA